MKHKIHTSKWVIINVTCIATSLCCLALTFWGNLKNDGVLTTDAFIGVLATFIGVCATIILGLQIWNHLEFKNAQKEIGNLDAKIKRLDKIEQDIDADKLEIKKIKHDLSKNIANAFISMALVTDNLDLKSLYYLFTIIYDNWFSDNQEANAGISKVMLRRYQKLCKYINDKSIKHSYTYYLSLSKVSIPKEYPDYIEISKLHFDILDRIKKNKPEDKNESRYNPDENNE